MPVTPSLLTCSLSVCTRRDLPMPGSPLSSTTCPAPSFACAHRCPPPPLDPCECRCAPGRGAVTACSVAAASPLCRVPRAPPVEHRLRGPADSQSTPATHRPDTERYAPHSDG